MSPQNSLDGADGGSPFVCAWRPEGETAASVQVSGELDIATVPQLERTLREAFAHASLIVLDVHAVSFIDSSGLDILLAAAQRARPLRGRLVMVGAPRQVETVLDLTGVRDVPALALSPPKTGPGSETWPDARPAGGAGFDPLANPANEKAIAGRVMAVSAPGLWLHAPDGTILRAWAPSTNGSPIPVGAQLDVYLDRDGGVNGWRDAESGVAINQRRLPAGAEPATAVPLACRGTCGVTWQAPAESALIDHDERCLTCAGPLVRA
jgi:anti-anti-sigma factor